VKGRKPVPTSLHIVRGTYNATKHGQDRRGEPKPEGVLPAAPPPELTESQAAIWRAGMESAPAGLLTPADYHTYLSWVVACDQHEQARQAQAQLEADGNPPLLMKSGNTLVPSPYVSIMHRTHLRMMKAASELGFSPASRPRVSAGPAPERTDDAWGELKAIVGGNTWDKLEEPLTPQ
jgi:P27 family predicted phage terminase small subunit